MPRSSPRKVTASMMKMWLPSLRNPARGAYFGASTASKIQYITTMMLARTMFSATRMASPALPVDRMRSSCSRPMTTANRMYARWFPVAKNSAPSIAVSMTV